MWLDNLHVLLVVLVSQWMVVGLSGHPGVVVLKLAVLVHTLEHELAQILLHKEVGLIVWAPATTQGAAIRLHVQVRQKNMYKEFDIIKYDST